MKIFSLFEVINRPGFNDAMYNWETFESNTFFSLFTTNSEETRYGFDIRLTCQKPLIKKEMFCNHRKKKPSNKKAQKCHFCDTAYEKHHPKNVTISGDECMIWSDIFEEWPKAEINDFGNRTFEFLPNWEIIGNMTLPGSLYNITYIRWEDNRCRKISENGQPGCFLLGRFSN